MKSEDKHIRPLCSVCKIRPAAFNYKRKKKVYYRKKCDQCIKTDAGQKTRYNYSWVKSGYRKKSICEKCGFKSKHPAQMDVCLLYTSPSPRDIRRSRMPSSA